MATAEHSNSPALGPAVTVTPASPTTASPSSTQTPAASTTNPAPSANMTGHDNPTESETALISGSQSAQASSSKPATASTEKNEAAASSSATGRASPLETLTRRLSGKSAPKTGTTTDVAADGTTSEKKPRSTVPAVSPAPAASTSRAAPTASKPAAAASGVKAGQKKKKKRKGLAGLFVALGCLSAGEFEDEPKAKPASKDMAQKPGQTVTKTPTPATTTTAAAVPAKSGESKGTGADTAQTPAESSETGHRGETTNSTLVEDATKGQADGGAASKEAIVVAPVEPVHVPADETAGVTSSAVQPPGSGSELLQTTPRRPSGARRESDTTPANAAGTSSSEMAQTETSAGYTDVSESDIRAADEAGGAADEQEYGLEEEYEDEEDRLIAQGGMGIPLDENGHPAPLLPPMSKEHHGRKCLVLDLDETLLHSSFKMLPTADYIVPVEIESQTHNVYVIKRPGVDHFLTEMGKIYEVVVFTASLSKYADPVLDMLDPSGVVKHRLFRESCYNHKGNYVKDLSQLGRDMEGCIIIDNSPASYIFHPNNAVPVSTWFNDPHDTELTDLCPFLTDLATVDDIRGVLDGSI